MNSHGRAVNSTALPGAPSRQSPRSRQAPGCSLRGPISSGPAQSGKAANGPADRLARWYLDRLLAALEDDTVRTAFNEVNQLVKPASRLFAPDVALHVLTRR